MIPKTIHYCWFGRNPLPDSAVKCINSWRKFFPDYEIKEWNEDNFDVNSIPYTAEAYEMDDIIAQGPYMGMETVWTYPTVAPGLGMAAESGHNIYKQAIDCYSRMHFSYENGMVNHESIVPMTTRILKEAGMKPGGDLQQVEGIWIYPCDFFNPFDDLTGKLNITDNTYTIHWYTASWRKQSRFIRWTKRAFHRLVGDRMHSIHRMKNQIISKLK